MHCSLCCSGGVGGGVGGGGNDSGDRTQYYNLHCVMVVVVVSCAVLHMYGVHNGGCRLWRYAAVVCTSYTVA